MKQIRWRRIWANAFAGFFTSLGGIITASFLLKAECSVWYLFLVSGLVALIQAGVAFTQELKKEVERGNGGSGGGNPKPNSSNFYLLF